MEHQIIKIVQEYYGEIPSEVKFLGGGFYGKVYLAALNKEPYQVVLKIFLKEGFGYREKEQLLILRSNALVKMPKTYFLRPAETDFPYEVLAMEYLEGKNCGEIKVLPEAARERIGSQIVDNLIAFHQVIHPEGFGELNSENYEKEWCSYYYKEAESIYQKTKILHQSGNITDDILHTVETAYHFYHKIFYLPVQTARLIHGDYNTYNILLNSELTEVAAVIDPFNCSYADSEYDLYQLSNVNGIYFGLLEKYKNKFKLSENFEIKYCFYELFTEIRHYYDSGVTPNHEFLKLEAEKLAQQMKKFI